MVYIGFFLCQMNQPYPSREEEPTPVPSREGKSG